MSVRSQVETALQARLGPDALGACGPQGARLLEALREASSGGKRFRPWLVGAVHSSLDGRRADAVPVLGAAVELLHTAFVVHDDVIDGDQSRRGRPTVVAAFRDEALLDSGDRARAAAYGLAGAVLTGDLALSAAIRTVATAPVPADVRSVLLDLVDEALAVSAAGELADAQLAARRQRPTLAEVLSMEERKTAVYSFALPMQLGAVLAGASAARVADLGEVGRHLGIAFQLRDDLLGVFGDPTQTGKSRLSDLREGKCTALVIHAQGTSQWVRIDPHWGRHDLTEADALVVRQALEDGGSRRFVEDLVTDYLDVATRAGRAAGLPAELLDGLVELCVPPEEGAA